MVTFFFTESLEALGDRMPLISRTCTAATGVAGVGFVEAAGARAGVGAGVGAATILDFLVVGLGSSDLVSSTLFLLLPPLANSAC